MNFRVKVFVLMFLVLAFVGVSKSVFSEEANSKNKKIVLSPIYVTAMRYDLLEKRTSANISLVDRQDIENSNAQTTVDLLRNETDILVRDWTGNGTKASIDIRGFGEQAGMNTAVLIDGRKVNEVDLSGVDWTQIPIDQIDRIEIIRGGSGSVMYGDNASSGVVNIITRSAREGFHLGYKQKYGSYDLNEEKGIIEGTNKYGISYLLRGGRKATHGYRNNSYYKNYEFSSNLKYEVDPDLILRFSNSWHKDQYGLPGALSSRDLELHGRQYSAYANDFAKTKDYNFVGGFDKGVFDIGKIIADISFRRRTNYSYFIGANAGWNPILRSTVNTWIVTPKYVLDNPIFNLENLFVTGVDFSRNHYNADAYDSDNVFQDMTDVKKTTAAGYIQDSLVIIPKVSVVGGYRYEGSRYEFLYDSLSQRLTDEKRDTIARAYNGGIIYEYIEGSQVFCNANQSFRLPAVDEYFAWGTLNTELKPQKSRNYDVGVRQRINNVFEAGATLFWMNLKNELYYDPLAYSNDNYGKTRRRGLELSGKLDLLEKKLSVYGNYTYLHATFRDGDYKGKIVPMVPKTKIGSGVRISLPKDITFNLLGSYVGKRYFINDQSNLYPKLKSYILLDTNVSWKIKSFSIIAGINNILNAKFYEYGVCSASSGAVNYYPAPKINYFVEAKYEF